MNSKLFGETTVFGDDKNRNNTMKLSQELSHSVNPSLNRYMTIVNQPVPSCSSAMIHLCKNTIYCKYKFRIWICERTFSQAPHVIASFTRVTTSTQGKKSRLLIRHSYSYTSMCWKSLYRCSICQCQWSVVQSCFQCWKGQFSDQPAKYGTQCSGIKSLDKGLRDCVLCREADWPNNCTKVPAVPTL